MRLAPLLPVRLIWLRVHRALQPGLDGPAVAYVGRGLVTLSLDCQCHLVAAAPAGVHRFDYGLGGGEREALPQEPRDRAEYIRAGNGGGEPSPFWPVRVTWLPCTEPCSDTSLAWPEFRSAAALVPFNGDRHGHLVAAAPAGVQGVQRGRGRGRRRGDSGRRRWDSGRRGDSCGRAGHRLPGHGVGPQEDHGQDHHGAQRDQGDLVCSSPGYRLSVRGQASQPGLAAGCGRRGNASSGGEREHAVRPLRSSGRRGERPPGGCRTRRKLTRRTRLRPGRSGRNPNAKKPLHGAPPLRRASSSTRLALARIAHFTQT